MSAACLHNRVHQDNIDRGEIPGVTTRESAELTCAKRRIRELEMEVEILRCAFKILGQDGTHLKGFTR